jgi:hydroxymethylpyrimidine pyrophosphatase-like HAD family hydrolase
MSRRSRESSNPATNNSVSQPPFALLADIDGPISNPDAKSIVNPRILPALVDLLKVGVPVVFNTGRSSDFVEQNVFVPLRKHQPTNLHLVHGVCEKGAVWLSLEDDGTQWHFVDEEISVPSELHEPVRKLVEERFAETMFFDDTKETMISVERRPDVDHSTYHDAQPAFLADLEAICRNAGHAVTKPGPDARNGKARLVIDASIISVDLESVMVGKDLGASRAFALLHDSRPQQWRTIGDSSIDYDMADWLHTRGEAVTHVDVGPKREKKARPYEVLIANDGIHDEAGGAYVEWLARTVNGHNSGHEKDFA